MKVKEETEKAGLKLNIQKTKIMASGPITSWQIDGETVADFIFLGSIITADGDCSHGINVMTNLDSTVKSRDMTLPTKVCLVKARQGFSSSQKTSSQGFSSSHVWMGDLDYKES